MHCPSTSWSSVKTPSSAHCSRDRWWGQQGQGEVPLNPSHDQSAIGIVTVGTSAAVDSAVTGAARYVRLPCGNRARHNIGGTWGRQLRAALLVEECNYHEHDGQNPKCNNRRSVNPLIHKPRLAVIDNIYSCWLGLPLMRISMLCFCERRKGAKHRKLGLRMSVDRRIGLSRTSLAQSQKCHLAVALPKFNVMAARKTCRLPLRIVVIHAGQIDGRPNVPILHQVRAILRHPWFLRWNNLA